MSHLYDAHGIKRKDGGFQEYLDQHFDAPQCCCGCGNKVSLHKRGFTYSLFFEGCDGLKHSRNPSRIEFYLHLNLSVDEAITAFRDHKSRTAKKYSTEELRKRLAERNIGARNPSSYKSIERRTGKDKTTIKQELSIRSKDENNGFFGRRHTDETKRKSAKARSKQCKIVTKPELVVWGMLQSFDLDFEFEHLVDKYCVDFLFDNIIIEVYGDYWHSEKMTSRGKLIDKVEKDKQRIANLQALGYTVHVFWESEIMKTPKEAFAKLKRIINEN
jgi:very-short-patch-repair endonuclease